MKRLVSPRWLVLHVLVLALIVTMINLGFWQLRRLDDKRALNAILAERTELPVAPIEQILPTTVTSTNDPIVAAQEWKRISATGRYDLERAVTVINRSQNGTAGKDSLVPFVTSDGRTLLVNRGFVPLAMDIPSPAGEEMTVVGYLRRTQTRGTLGPIDSTDPTNTEFHRFDVDLIGARATSPVIPMFLQLLKESPTTNSQWPAPVALPEQDEGPHLSYSFQWFFFSVVALVGWIVAMRRTVVGQRKEKPSPSTGDDADDQRPEFSI